MVLRRRLPSYVAALLIAAGWLAAPSYAQTQPPATAPQVPTAPQSPNAPSTTAPSTNAPPAPSTAPTTTTPTAPANQPAATNPNPQVGPNAVAQVQPNLAVRAPANNQNFSLARVPNMIGDQTGGGGAQIVTTGIVSQTLSHPTLTNGRLNIAENNSPVVGDRVYFSYRHFNAASSLDYLNGTPTGGSADQSINRFMFGIERQFTDTSSLEFRLPFNAQLDSNLLVSQFNANQASVPYNATNFELGNINLIFKQALIDAEYFYFSGGVGLNVPTAPDVKVRTRIDDPQFSVFDYSRNPPTFVGVTNLNYDNQTTVRNQTANLSPYLSAAYRPSDRSFVQGFLQWDLPLGRSSVAIDETYTIGGSPTARQSSRGDLEQQVLMRANVGLGRWLRYRDSSRYFHSIAAMFEVHYTTALNDAEIVGPFQLSTISPPSTSQTSVGNIANRVDVVNLTAGLPMVVGRTTITNAFTVPVRSDLNRAFDFEYSLLIDRRF